MAISLARIALVLIFLTPPLLPPARPAGPPASATLHYLSPLAGAPYVQTATALALRLDDDLNPASLTPDLFSVVGLTSGVHTGSTHVALDGRTAIFKPDAGFAVGETVSVTIQSGLATQGGAIWAGMSYTFTISSHVPAALTQAEQAASLAAEAGANASSASQQPAETAGSFRVVDPANYVTLPAAMPVYTVTGTLSGTVTDTYAMGLQPWLVPNPFLFQDHLLLVDGIGEPVFYETTPPGSFTVDFKRQPGNRLSYWSGLDNRFHVLDNTYTEIATVGAGNGYVADLHELQLLPNGEALLMVYDDQNVDMSQIAVGGLPTATVVGLVVQSIDAANDVVFEWRSWDHFLITDTTVSLTTATVDYVHGNAIDLDDDGNLLVSSRHLDEITKINRDTGAVIWRWGGAQNEFAMDSGAIFYHQHDIRRQADGTVTLFDNHNNGPYSRGLTFELDEENKIATLVDEQRRTPDVYGFAMGSHSIADDGSTLIGWGAGLTTFSEFAPDDSVRLEVTVDSLYRSYRSLRFSWAAYPAWPPLLVLTTTTASGASLVAGGGPALYFSWNGATEVGSYEVYAVGPAINELLTVVPRSAFENHVDLADLPTAPEGACAYRVRALDHNGQSLPRDVSNLVNFSEPCVTAQEWLPLVFQLP